MKADFTRITYRPGNNYSRVLMQQGRAQLDSDWNEQGTLTIGTIRQLAADLIGAHGGPLAGSVPGANAAPVPAPAFAALPLPTPGTADFLLLPGHYYVDGILCSNTTTPVIILGYPQNTAQPGKPATSNTIQVFSWTTDGIAFQKNQYVWLYNTDASKLLADDLAPELLQITDIDYGSKTLTVSGDISAYVTDAQENGTQTHGLRRACTYMTQVDYAPPPLTTNGEYLVYLDVWERAVTCVEDAAIREVALGGPDTTARARTIAQVKTLLLDTGVPTGADAVCMTPYELKAMLEPANRGFLAARAKPTLVSSDPCTIAPDAMYRGPENQLYRVEIHTGTSVSGDSSQATFKWSRENGAVVFPIAGGAGTTYTLETLGRDDRFSLVEGDWVEMVDDAYVLANNAAPLCQVQSIDHARMVVILSGLAATTTVDLTRHPMLRRWDEKAGDPAQGGLTLSTVDNAALIFPNARQAVAAVPATHAVQYNQVGAAGQINKTDTPVQRQFGRLIATPMTSPWFELEDGVQVQFTLPPQYASEPQFRTGDYWLIPARVATGNVEWPTESIATAGAPATPVAIPMLPEGVVHHYAPIARISVAASAAGGATVTVEHDCTVVFGPGNGVEAFLQGGQPYSQAGYELVFEAPSQQEQVEAVAKPKAAAKAKAAPAAKK
ncbi:MAG TPA: DUF6519 domain-containing protein [Rhizomicrobium sp.]|jgi:hypothetical protein